MSAVPQRVRVLHINDAAFTAARILARAQRDGQPWSFFPRAVADPSWSGVSGQIRFAARGGMWAIKLMRASAKADLLHIHSGAMLKHLRFIRKPFVLHLHGTDIRTLQYDPAWRDIILRGVRDARAVLYSTPDLAEHALPLRPDAIYMPVPIDLTGLPQLPAHAEKRLFFSSRWEEVKGLKQQLKIAQKLRTILLDDVELTGLDWGPGATAAGKAGVRLVPKMSHEAFLQYLAHSAGVIGQSAGILASSELEALGIGVPVYAALKPGYYPDSPPVGGGTDAWENPEALITAITAGLNAPQDPDTGPRWVERTHEAELAYKTLLELYPTLLN